MTDYFTEQLIEKKPDKMQVLIEVILMILTVLALILSFKRFYGVIIFVVFVVIDVFMGRQLKQEYEYAYINGQLDIDVIIAKARRKKLFEMNVSEMEIIAPAEDQKLRTFPVKETKNFTSNCSGKKVYAMVVRKNGELVKILFEPNKAILDGFTMYAPRKVVLRED